MTIQGFPRLQLRQFGSWSSDIPSHQCGEGPSCNTSSCPPLEVSLSGSDLVASSHISAARIESSNRSIDTIRTWPMWISFELGPGDYIFTFVLIVGSNRSRVITIWLQFYIAIEIGPSYKWFKSWFVLTFNLLKMKKKTVIFHSKHLSFSQRILPAFAFLVQKTLDTATAIIAAAAPCLESTASTASVPLLVTDVNGEWIMAILNGISMGYWTAIWDLNGIL